MPGKKRPRPGIARFFRGITGKVPFRDLDLTCARRMSPASLLRRSRWALGKGKRVPQRSIGIDIGRSHVRAVQMAQTPEGLRLEKTFATQVRRSTDSLSGILRSLTEEHGFDPRAEVAVSLPHHVFFFADVKTDTAGLERLRAGDTADLNSYFPIQPEDLITQICSVPPPSQTRDRSSLPPPPASCFESS